jgi:hypothetical protein
MKILFSAYGTSGVTKLPLYTEGTENVSWHKGVDSQTGSGFGDSANTYTEGGSYITLKILNEPTGFITSELATVTNNHVDITGYKRVMIDWEVISAGTFALIVDDTKNGDIDNFNAKVTYGAGTGRKTSSLAINSLGVDNYYIRVNAYAITAAPDTEEIEIRIHKVWLEK